MNLAISFNEKKNRILKESQLHIQNAFSYFCVHFYLSIDYLAIHTFLRSMMIFWGFGFVTFGLISFNRILNIPILISIFPNIQTPYCDLSCTVSFLFLMCVILESIWYYIVKFSLPLNMKYVRYLLNSCVYE